MKSGLNWKEFDGIRNERVSSLTGFIQIALYRKEPAFGYIVIASATQVSSDGWDNGRNEQFTHWAGINLPE